MWNWLTQLEPGSDDHKLLILLLVIGWLIKMFTMPAQSLSFNYSFDSFQFEYTRQMERNEQLF